MMELFRRPLRAHELTLHPMQPADLTTIQALCEQTAWVALSLPLEELATVIEPALSVVAWHGDHLWAAALLTWSRHPVAWIRALAIRQPLRPTEVLPLLLKRVEQQVAAAGGRSIYVMSDQFDVVWLRPTLLTQRYTPQLEVVAYEKRTMTLPAEGNSAVLVRPATQQDVPAIAAVDATAFPPEWNKSSQMLSSVLPIAPCYLVSEAAGHVVGYAFATLHHGGLVAHLVRIAVDQAWQRQALGVRLLAEVIRWCQRHDVQVLSLNTQSTNTQAQRLYEWFGFTRIDDTQLVLHKPAELFAASATV